MEFSGWNNLSQIREEWKDSPVDRIAK